MRSFDSRSFGCSRRRWLRRAAVAASAGFGVGSTSGWLPALAAAAGDARPRRNVILLWMAGGPSQTDTFDPKPGHANGGPLKPIETSVPGIWIGEHLPKLARQMQHAAVLRSMSTREGDHERATYLLHTGYTPGGAIQYPTLGSVLSKELGDTEAALPNFVSIASFRQLSPGAHDAGFLGPRYAALEVGGDLQVRHLTPPAGPTPERIEARRRLLSETDVRFAADRPGPLSAAHVEAYRAAARLQTPAASKAFRLDEEPSRLRDAYGRTPFGQGCLLARRLVERGVPFVEVALTGTEGNNTFGWDTHNDNFAACKRLCGVLDAGWATLLDDLRTRGLLEHTLVVWMGEFGRTPQINRTGGRDHFPQAWSTVLCGGGIRGGQVVGETSPDGMQVRRRPIKVGDLTATICRAVGVDPMGQNMSNVGRPIRFADPEAAPIDEVLA